MAEFRRIPMRRLIAKLGLGEFNNVGPLVDFNFAPKQVKILLKQHAGAPSAPVVKNGDRVKVGDLLAAPAPGNLGARIHASIDGVVTVEKDAVLIKA
jgi:Na+-translocating ferredoxin:NAD+ oxidoreductase RnfC subunit